MSPDPDQFRPDAMLLAAGLGRRLLPLTASRPKPLVEVAGRALVDWVVEAARAEGIGRFVVNAHHHADKLEAHVDGLAARWPGSRFRLSDERAALLETGGGVRRALPLLETDPVLVMNTDAFWLPEDDRPIARMLAALDAAEDADAVLLCVHPGRALGFRRSHDFCLDPRGRVTLDTGAPVIYAGVALLRRRLFAGAPDGAFSLNLLFERALEADTLRGVALAAPWYHVGDPAALLEAGRALAER